MRFALVIFLLVFQGCASTKAAQPTRTLPSPLVAADLPERPNVEPIPPAADWTVPCAGYLLEKEGEEEPELVKNPGVCMSVEKAVLAGKYVVAYNELRQLYVIDLKTWGREREIYDRHLEAADGEIKHWKKEAVRSWWEKHSGQIGLGAGLIFGAVITVAIVEAVEQVKQ